MYTIPFPESAKAPSVVTEIPTTMVLDVEVVVNSVESGRKAGTLPAV